MKIGIIGLPQSGKSTIFKLLTNVETKNNLPVNTGVAKVLDPRIDYLGEAFKSKKVNYPTIEFVDVAGFALTQDKSGRGFWEALRHVDAVVQVIRAFDSVIGEDIDPTGDLDQIQSELVLADWSLVETRIENLERENKRVPQDGKEKEFLIKCKNLLEKGLPLQLLELTEEESKRVRNYNFFTLKPLLIVINLDETQIKDPVYPQQSELNAWAKERKVPIVKVSGQLEMEINEMDEVDKKLFMDELGIEETGIRRIAREVYRQLGLISFFTAGETQIKAWTISQGTTAKSGAGKIHSDIERGFIRAEVVGYNDFASLGNMQKVKEKGLCRLEGKEYVIADGDIISFRFNV